MIVVPAGVKVHLALGHTDMRKGLDGLATLIQEHLKKDPFSGHLFVFRGKNASLLKILFWDVLQVEELGLQIAPVRQQKLRSVAAFRLDVSLAEPAGAHDMGDAERIAFVRVVAPR